jgi:hypothetical protein
MRVVIFYSSSNGQEVEVGRVWNEEGELRGTVNEIFLEDLKNWLNKSGDEIEEYLENLHNRFDGDLLYASRYQEENNELIS